MASKKKTSVKRKTAPKVHRRRHAPHGPHHILFYAALFFVVFIVTYTLTVNFDWAASEEVAMQQPQNTVAGIYSGVTPCADCSGIDTKLMLNTDTLGAPSTYKLKLTYQGRDTSFTEDGTWTTHELNGEDIITLTPKGKEQTTSYMVLNNSQIRQLDGDLQPIPTSMPFTLTKE